MTADAWVTVVLLTVGMLAAYFLPRESRKSTVKARSMRRCAQDAELSRERHGRHQ